VMVPVFCSYSSPSLNNSSAVACEWFNRQSVPDLCIVDSLLRDVSCMRLLFRSTIKFATREVVVPNVATLRVSISFF